MMRVHEKIGLEADSRCSHIVWEVNILEKRYSAGLYLEMEVVKEFHGEGLTLVTLVEEAA